MASATSRTWLCACRPKRSLSSCQGRPQPPLLCMASLLPARPSLSLRPSVSIPAPFCVPLTHITR